jgi:tetratricopeptide (TPR) repeat protein
MLVDVYWEEYDKVKSGFLFAAATPLEKLVQSGNQTLVIHRLLGDIYLRLGRWQEAEEKYQKVILLAESEKNYFEIAAAQEGLAHVAVIKGDFSEAEEFLLKAKQGYQIAGDGQQVDLIQGWLEKLESKL